MKMRWLLPAAHGLTDCVLLLALMLSSHSRVIFETAFLQNDAEDWVPVHDGAPPRPFLVLMSGNLPAGIVSSLLRPHAGIVAQARWDPIWFLLHECIALPSWYLFGVWADKARVFRKAMIAYLAARILVAVTGFYDEGIRIQAIFWFGFALWLVGFGIWRAARTILKSPPAPPNSPR